jgi:hypothetical protein
MEVLHDKAGEDVGGGGFGGGDGDVGEGAVADSGDAVGDRFKLALRYFVWVGVIYI